MISRQRASGSSGDTATAAASFAARFAVERLTPMSAQIDFQDSPASLRRAMSRSRAARSELESFRAGGLGFIPRGGAGGPAPGILSRPRGETVAGPEPLAMPRPR